MGEGEAMSIQPNEILISFFMLRAPDDKVNEALACVASYREACCTGDAVKASQWEGRLKSIVPPDEWQ